MKFAKFVLIILLAAEARAAITVTPSTLGNLFLATEAVSIPVTSSGAITWTVTNYWGSVVATGSGSPIVPGLNIPGYYDVEIKDGTTILKTSFGIVTPATIGPNSRFGTTTHFAQFHDQSVIPLLARAGIKHIRDDQYWAHIENPKGTFNYPAKFTNYMAATSTNGIAPLSTLLWSNKFYDYEFGDFTAPHSDAGRAGYANYALNVLNKYPQIKEAEVWNEYNAGTFILGPATANKPLYYKLMLQKVHETIKPSHPNVRLVAGATVPVAHGFLKNLFAQGAMPYLDAVSVHYPSAVEVDISELKRLIREANGGQEKPIWVTEFSAGSRNEAAPDVTASYTAQTAVRMLGAGVERIYYYLEIDDGLFPLWGLFGGSPDARGKFRPHPAGIAYANVIRQLDGAVYQSRYGTSPSIYAFKFLKGTQPVSVLWSNRPVWVKLATTSDIVVTDQMGGSRTIQPVSGSVFLKLTKDVQYVSGSVTNAVEIDNDLLADSVSGYSKTSGTNGWSYGWAALASTAQWNPASFQPMAWAIWNSDNYRWIKAGASYPFANGSQMHPTGNWAIRRWASNYAGAAALEGELSRGASGDGVGIRIFVDGAEVHNQTLAPNQKSSYSVPVTLAVGSKVDFTINQAGESSFDATGFTSRIIKPLPPLSAPQNLRIAPNNLGAPNNLRIIL